MAFMLPFLGQSALALLPGLMSKLSGDPYKRYQQQVQNILAPQNMSRLTQGFYQQALGSPAYGMAQRQIGAGTNQTMNRLASNAGISGVSNSGVGNLGASIGPSLAGNAMAGLQTNMWNNAGQQAQNAIQQQLGQLGNQMPLGQTQQLFGAGIGSLGPLLQQLLTQHLGQSAMNNMVAPYQNAPFQYQGPHGV